jgi:hypothetical protein
MRLGLDMDRAGGDGDRFGRRAELHA